MDEQQTEETPSRVRKTVSFTHKQLGIGGGIIAAITAVGQIKGSFWTREEGVAQSKDIARLELVIQNADQKQQAANAELTRVVERKTDKIMDLMRDIERRGHEESARLERRIENLEVNKPKGRVGVVF